jgi:hypothetical protein
MRGVGLSGRDHIRIPHRRERRVSGIFDWRRRWIGHGNFGWRHRRQITRRIARLGPGRLRSLLLRSVGMFQSEFLSWRHARGVCRGRCPANALLLGEFQAPEGKAASRSTLNGQMLLADGCTITVRGRGCGGAELVGDVCGDPLAASRASLHGTGLDQDPASRVGEIDARSWGTAFQPRPTKANIPPF